VCQTTKLQEEFDKEATAIMSVLRNAKAAANKVQEEGDGSPWRASAVKDHGVILDLIKSVGLAVAEVERQVLSYRASKKADIEARLRLLDDVLGQVQVSFFALWQGQQKLEASGKLGASVSHRCFRWQGIDNVL
jgi:hypothetical protein